ncbi:hypothetical protein ES703_45220 [subsurface metagenome]
MAHGAPDYTQQVQVVIVQAQPADESAGGAAGNFNLANAGWTEVVRWTVTPLRTGELKEILIISDNYDKTIVKITIDGDVWVNNWNPTSAMPIIFEDLRLAAGSIVLVEAHSDGVVTIDVDAIIVGKEVV